MRNDRDGSSDAEDVRDAAGEREKTFKCGCLPQDAGDLAGLLLAAGVENYEWFNTKKSISAIGKSASNTNHYGMKLANSTEYWDPM